MREPEAKTQTRQKHPKPLALASNSMGSLSADTLHLFEDKANYQIDRAQRQYQKTTFPEMALMV